MQWVCSQRREAHNTSETAMASRLGREVTAAFRSSKTPVKGPEWARITKDVSSFNGPRCQGLAASSPNERGSNNLHILAALNCL